MGVEINHPTDIKPPSPDSFDMELDWRKIRQQWLRAVAPQFGLDVSKLVIGQILNCITDDGNMVTWVNFGFKTEDGLISRLKLLGRLAWESETPELPTRIRAILRKEKAEIEQLDGGNEASFRQILAANLAARAEVLARQQKDPQIQAADDYYAEVTQFGMLDAPYQSFVKQLQGSLPAGHRRP